jgi:GT2 family glycosyltransferase/SAM-dependent methyltransferase
MTVGLGSHVVRGTRSASAPEHAQAPIETSVFRAWRIVHIDLKAHVESLRRERADGGCALFFWWGDIPIGRCDLRFWPSEIPAHELVSLGLQAAARAMAAATRSDASPPRVEDLVAAKRPLANLVERVRALEAGCAKHTISVVICTRERPEHLQRCLRSLAQLRVQPDEIVVVDNAPKSDATANVVASAAGVRYVVESRPGLSVARNTGIRESRGDIIVFTDDDVEVHPAWLSRLCGALADPGVWATTGLVLPAALDTEARCLFDRASGGHGRVFTPRRFDRAFFAQHTRVGAPVWDVGAGASCAFRREVFTRLGEFDERLGAGSSGCSEDSEIWYRILAAGQSCQYEPSAVVFHYHRQDMAGLRHQTFQYMRGHVTALLIQHERYGDRGNLVRAGLTLPNYYARRALNQVFGRGSAPSLLTREVSGYLAGFAYYVRNRGRGRGRAKAARATFLAQNPFPFPLTLGFFYREKMRAIHRVAPDVPLSRILDIGGGTSGLAKQLYTHAHVVVVDRDPAYARAPCNRQAGVTFVRADGTSLPFPDESFDAVTMFDLIEHVVDDQKLVAEALRVLRPGGYLIVSTPQADWRYPYYSLWKHRFPAEEKLLSQWGHVRRGYELRQLEQLVGSACDLWSTFISPVTVIAHDIAFSELPRKRALVAALAPLTWTAYLCHRPHDRGTETAARWTK